MLDLVLLARYLRQRAEFGERELFLDAASARDLLVALASSAGAMERRVARRRDGGNPPASASAARAMIREILATPTAASAAPLQAAGKPLAMPAEPRETPGPGDTRLSPTPRPAMPPSPVMTPNPALAALSAEAGACTACRLSEGRRNVVFGEGSSAAELVIVGEAPGQEEDRTGRPFVGPAGKLLDLLLMSAGFPRDKVYICNTLKCRPPQNRNPLPEELAACSRLLRGQLGAIGPKALLAVGKFAAQTLVGSEDSISRLRGRVFVYERLPLVVTYHPAFLLRSPQWTLTAWEDFQLARKVLDEQA